MQFGLQAVVLESRQKTELHKRERINVNPSLSY